MRSSPTRLTRAPKAQPRKPRRLPAGLWLALTLAAACAPRPAAEPAAPERVENPSLGIAVAALPEPFEVAENGPGVFELAAPGPARLSFAVGPEQVAGINLVEEVKERKAWFEQAEGGGYFGNRELRAPLGTAFTARGTYTGAAGVVEETWVYFVHPTANRLLTLTYTYPPNESQDRVQQLVAVLGELEGLPFAGESAPVE